MKSLLSRMRIASLALALALVAQPVLSTMTPTTAQAGEPSGHLMREIINPGGGLPGGGGGSAGGWIISGIFISVASIMFCAALVGAEEGRELTPEEAWAAGLIPLSCLLNFAGDDDDEE